MTPNPSTIGRLAPGQRWGVGRKREVVLRLLRGESMELLSRELGAPIYKLEQWREKADAALDGALKERESDPASGELAAAMQRIGELVPLHGDYDFFERGIGIGTRHFGSGLVGGEHPVDSSAALISLRLPDVDLVA